MKREIKFRAKTLIKDEVKWVYGHYSEGAPNYHYISNPNGEVWPINPETLGEFAGLLDRNGKEVFEGDIITGITVRLSGDEKIFGYIEYDNSSAKYVVKFRSDRGWLLSKGLGYFHEIIVNGNIYENPELLK